jgi:hypothetical protein
MTERQGGDPVESLRARLGVQYRARLDEGRAELARVLGDELGLGRDDAERAVRELIDAGRIRYVTGVEEDVTHDMAAQHDEHSDANARDDGATERSDNLTINAIPGRGNDRSGGVSGLTAPSTSPLVQGGIVAPGATPLAAGVDIGDNAAERQQMGYWDLGGGAGGVVPSSTRKGQVEPRGT